MSDQLTSPLTPPLTPILDSLQLIENALTSPLDSYSPPPTVTTDKPDYAPGSTVTITASGFELGSSVQFEIADDPNRPGDDGNPDIYIPFTVTDGVTIYNVKGMAIGGDLDGTVNGQVVTTWFVPTDNNGTGGGIPDALNATLNLIATGTGTDGILGTTDDQVAITTFTDSAGDFKLDFAAAAPYTYDHWVGGGSWEDKTIGRAKDVVESLEGGDFKSGQLVSYFLEIDTNASATEQNQAIQVKLGFLASTTGQAGVGQDWIQNIQVNYVSERVDYTQTPPPAGSLGGLNNRRQVIDSGNALSRNDGMSYATLVEQGFETKRGVTKLGTNGLAAVSNTFGPIANVDYSNNDTNSTSWLYDEQMTRLYSVFNVYDLDPGEKVVVRVDVHLGDDGKKPTGNLQGFLLDANVITPTSGSTSINTGNQTIPFKLTKDLTLDNSYGLNLEKYVTTDIAGYTSLLSGLTDTAANNFFNANKNKEVTIVSGSDVVYLYKITNTGTTNLTDVRLYDDSDSGAAGTLVYETFIPRPYGGNNPPFLYLKPDGTGTNDPAEAAKILALNGEAETGNQLSSNNEIKALDPKSGGYNSPTTGITTLKNGSGDFNLGQNGINDLAPGATIILAYRTTLSTVEVVNNEAVAAFTAGANGGGQQGDLFGVVDTAKVNVVAAGASLAGNVYQDLNNNGVKDTGEAGIAGVTMTLTNGTNTYTVTTDSTGRYLFNGIVAASNYTLTETQPLSFLDGKDQKTGTANGTFTNQPVTGNDTVGSITIAANTAYSNYNFGEIRPATISGMAYYDLNSSLTRDANETGRSGITITLSGTNDLGNSVSQTLTTDANGRYLFSNLRPGTYSVTGDGTENVGTVGGVTTGSGNGSPAPSIISNIVLSSGSSGINYDFGVFPASSVPTLGSISGTVYQDTDNSNTFARTGSLDKALQGVTLTLKDSNNNIVATTKTDANGNYTFNNLAAGTYSVTETQPQYFDPNINKGDGGLTSYVSGLGQNNSNVISNIVVNGNNRTGNDFGEVPPASLSGYVYVDIDPDGSGTNAIRNSLFDSNDVVLSGVTITLYNSSNNQVIGTTTTDSSGYYQFTGLAAGTYYVVETQPANYTTDGEDIGTTQSGTIGTNASQIDNQITAITLNNGEGGVDYNFREVSTKAVIQGYVYQDTNNDGIFSDTEYAISGVTVGLYNSTGVTLIATTTTDSSGKYVFSNVDNTAASTTYLIKETQPSGYIDGKDSVYNGTTATLPGGTNDQLSVTVTPSQSLYKDYLFGEGTLNLSSISGTVYVDANNNGLIDSETKISGVTITLTGTNDLGQNVNLTTTTDANGNYSFTDLRPSNASGYTLTETQPSNYLDGQETAGTTGGTVNNTTPNSQTITNIVLGSGVNSTGNNFGELQPSSISGTVYVDANNNGLIDSETKISGVTITLTGTDDLGNSVSQTTTTDANGNYSFTGLRPSNASGYTLTETQPSNYLDGQETAGSSGGTVDNATLNSQTISNIILNPGVNSTGNNFGELQPATSSISGTVYVDANNNGLIDSETKISGVTITLTGTDDLGNSVSQTTTTDANGNYSFIGLRPSNASGYTLTETQPSNYLDGQETAGTTGGTVDNATLNSQTISNIILNPGVNSTGNNFGELQPATIFGNVFHDVNNDGIKGASEPIVEGVLITLRNSAGTVIGTRTTDFQGNYIFNGLSQGTYTVTETQPTKYLDGKDNLDGTPITNSNTTDVINVTLSAGSAKAANFGEIAKTTLSGVVYADTNNNGTQDLGEAGIAGTTVTLTGDNGTTNTATTAADGTYSISNLLPGTYTVTETQPNNYLDGKESSSDPLAAFNNASDSNTISNVKLVLGEADTANFGELAKGSLSGKVSVTSDSTAISGVVLTLTGTDDRSNNIILTITTDGNGNYTFNNLRPSDATGYTITETQPTGFNDDADTAGTIGGSVAVNDVISGIVVNQTNPVGSGYNFSELYKGGSLSGYVYEDLNSDGNFNTGDVGIAGVTITLTDNSVSQTAVTDSSGKYIFTDLLQATYTISESQPTAYNDSTDNVGTINGTTNGSVTNDQFASITLGNNEQGINYNFGEIIKLSSLSGVVYNDLNLSNNYNSGEEIGSVTITLNGTNDLGQTVIQTIQTNSDGTYSFPNLRPGNYTLTETQPSGYVDGSPNTIPVTLLANQNIPNNNFREVELASLTGKVYRDISNDGIIDAVETGVSGVTLTLSGTTLTGLTVNLTTTTNGTGDYSFASLTPGNYTLTETQPAGLRDGKETTQNLTGSVVNNTIDSNTVTSITLSSGQNGVANFGELPPAVINGKVFVDSNNNGTLDTGENKFLSNIFVTLTGTDDRGNTVSVVALTNANGDYSFTNLRPSNAIGYTVTETQPSGYLDANGSPNTNTQILTAGQTQTRNFGEIVASNLSGTVYLDANSNASFDSGDTGIAGVTLILSGTDDQGNTVNKTVVTGADGNYNFIGLRPSISGYTISEIQPAGYTNGTNNVGTVNGSSSGTISADQITTIILGAGQQGINYNFGEVGTPPATSSISGYVYVDRGNDGIKGANETPLAGVTLTITGNNGNISQTVVTDANGKYVFALLPASDANGYTITETQPAPFGQPYTDGKETLGTGGTGTIPLSTNDQFNIVIGAGVTATDYNFGEGATNDDSPIGLQGGSTGDLIDGGDGNDRIYSYDGNDTLIGGLGGDYIAGGTGADIFKINPTDSLLSGLDYYCDVNQTEGDRFQLSTGTPTGLFFAGSISGANLTIAATNAYATPNGSVTGEAVLGVNQAVFFKYGVQLYLSINNGAPGFSTTEDFLAKVTSGAINPADTLDKVLVASDYFI
jgi:SdrD B-like domain/Prealbumin-like fold domain/RTX calcium-binding nonapeptide repeat (4 copies)